MKSIGLFLLLIQGSLFAQSYCEPDDCLFWQPQPEPLDSAVLTYASNQWSIDEWDNITCTFPVQQCENLQMKLFWPVLPADSQRPLVVFIHGGAFIEGNYQVFEAEAREMARLGYVAATINYRLCKRNTCLLLDWVATENAALLPAAICNLNFWSDFGTGSYVATYDAIRAIRYLQDHAGDYHIDPDRVIVGGGSAGGWAALQVAYLDQDEANSLGNWEAAWGSLEPISGLVGVFSLAGAMYDTTFIDPEEALPTFLVHGTCDAIVCYDQDAPFHCNNSYPQLHGGGEIALRMAHQGMPYYLFTGTGMGHDVGPLSSAWKPELLRYMRETMLCGQGGSRHVVAGLNPESGECAILEQGPLQAPHPPRPAVGLATSSPSGGPPADCTLATGLDEVPHSRIYPNPASNWVEWAFEGPYQGGVSLFDQQGKCLHTQTVPGLPAVRLDLSAMPPGLYLLRRTDGMSVRVIHR
ncbi:MAG: T9SS C-terminal target domain-containing protein [Bacteroidetes bacterium]|nr:MAG: T9SS C-terminal target domain-containing protein [Bacteroidota bacterium]